MAEEEDKIKQFDLVRFIKRYWVQNRPFFIFVAFIFVMIFMLSSFKYLLH
jgi:hypothetical protein